MNSSINCIVVVKGTERYVWLFRDDQRTDVLRSVGRQAADDGLSLTWHDAARIAQKVRAIDAIS